MSLCCVQSIQPTIKRLNGHGVGAILDYAAESDVHDEKVRCARLLTHVVAFHAAGYP